MRMILLAAALSTCALSAAPAYAQSTATVSVREGAILTTADGRRLGRIARVVNNAAGDPVAASVIVDSRFVSVPLSTITVDGRRATTSLSLAQVRDL